MLYSIYPQDKKPERPIQVRAILDADIPFLPPNIANHFVIGNADFGVSLVAYEPFTEEPTYYGVLLCKKRYLEDEVLHGQGIELIEYSSSNECNPHAFIKLLRIIVIISKIDDGTPEYCYVYGKFTESASRNRLTQWHGFTVLPTNPQFLFQSRDKIIEIAKEIEND